MNPPSAVLAVAPGDIKALLICVDQTLQRLSDLLFVA
jgi:hypothetical protein